MLLLELMPDKDKDLCLMPISHVKMPGMVEHAGNFIPVDTAKDMGAIWKD